MTRERPWWDLYQARKDSADPEWVRMVEHYAWQEYIESENDRIEALIKELKESNRG